MLPPGGGIGEHFHNYCEEMFVILDGEAEYSIDSRTSVLKGPAGAVARLGHNHAISNQSGKPVQWMNINVGLLPHFYDAWNLDDGRVGAPKDALPQFIHMDLDRSLDKPMASFEGGKGTAMYHRGLDPSTFYSTWSYVDHLVLPPGVTAGPERQEGHGGSLLCDVGATAPRRSAERRWSIKPAMPCRPRWERAGPLLPPAAALEFMVIGIARDFKARRLTC